MAANKEKFMGLATGAGCGLGGLLAYLPCAGAGCASCLGCLGPGLGLAALFLARRLPVARKRAPRGASWTG